MRNLFNSIQLTAPKKNVFDLTHDVKTSFNFGELVPVLTMECVPGDKVNIGCDTLLRFAPLATPMMHRCDVYVHYFFCPTRLVWDGWEEFITLEDNVAGSPPFPYLTIQSDGSNYTKLVNFMNIPHPVIDNIIPTTDERVSAVPFAMYQKICNDYYRDQNQSNKDTDTLIDGDNFTNEGELLALRLRSWEHDYFTSALPDAQKGGEILMPNNFKDVPVTVAVPAANSTVTAAPANLNVPADVVDKSDPTSTSDMWAQTSDLLSTSSINDLRRAFKLQEWLERMIRGGQRYFEQTLSMFGVKSPDARLQRPEYITGIKSPMIISEVLNNSGTGIQGQMAGHGVGVQQGRYGSYFCQEHGYIIGIMSSLPKTAYMNGIARHFKKFDQFDYYWPQFANIGEQTIKGHEIFAFTVDTNTDWGYLPRYAEYKNFPNIVTGQFRNTEANWHMARNWTSFPPLNEDFMFCEPTYRTFADTDPDSDHIYAQILHKIRAVRPMPRFGTPSF